MGSWSVKCLLLITLGNFVELALAPLVVAPTEVKFEFLKSSFFVVEVFLWSNRVEIRMERSANREGRVNFSPTSIFFHIRDFYSLMC